MATCPRPSPGQPPRHTNKAIGMWCRAKGGVGGESCQVSMKTNNVRPEALGAVREAWAPTGSAPGKYNTVHRQTDGQTCTHTLLGEQQSCFLKKEA